MKREWKPGDVALVTIGRRRGDGSDEATYTAFFAGTYGWYGVSDGEGCGGLTVNEDEFVITRRPLVVIDPENREQVERLIAAVVHAQDWTPYEAADSDAQIVASVQAALREFANPTPSEPTDPSARVEDRRENIWRLLADGEWVCTSGPDIGEYLVWSRLAAERGPLTVEVQP